MTNPAHLPAATLHQYLHRTLPPDRHHQVRAHLDECEPCWQAWNRYRWDAAQTHPLYAQLAEYLGPAFQPYFDSSRALATEWDAANPTTDQEIAEFFRISTSYLYNLTIWEASGNRPHYLTHALATLLEYGARTVLDYGCGIGSDTLSFHYHGFRVIGCDYHSPSTAFLHWRGGHTIPVVEPGHLDSITTPDTLWIIDTLDHLTDIETELGAILSAVDLVVSEDLTVSCGHGRQRFHHRRPFAHIAATFAHHGLTPTENLPGYPIMFWTRHSSAGDVRCTRQAFE